MYREHGTDHEKVFAWSRIISYRRDKRANFNEWFKKHFVINGSLDDVIKIIDSNIGKIYVDVLIELKEKFEISVNKCNCIHSQTYLMDNYDTNGMCNNCGLKIKQ